MKGKNKEVEWFVRDDVNIKPRDAYTKEESEEMERKHLEYLKMLEKEKAKSSG